MNTSSLDDSADFAQSNATLPDNEEGYEFDDTLNRKMRTLLIWYAHMEIVLAVLAIVFASVVLLVIATNRSFHNATHYFIASLMMSDLGMAICVIVDGSFWLASHSIPTCSGLNRYLQHVAYQVSCTTLILLTLTRYDAILNPLQSINRWSNFRIASAICLSWFLSFLLHIPSYYQVCYLTTALEFIQQIYIYSITFLLPSLLLLFCYSRILWRVMRNTFRNKQIAATCKARAVPQGQAKLTRMVVFILLIFFLFRAPRSTFILYKFIVGWSSVHWFTDRILLLAFIMLEQLHSVVDPLVYALCAPQFRKYLVEKMRCCAKKKEVSLSVSTEIRKRTLSSP